MQFFYSGRLSLSLSLSHSFISFQFHQLPETFIIIIIISQVNFIMKIHQQTNGSNLVWMLVGFFLLLLLLHLCTNSTLPKKKQDGQLVKFTQVYQKLMLDWNLALKNIYDPKKENSWRKKKKFFQVNFFSNTALLLTSEKNSYFS